MLLFWLLLGAGLALGVVLVLRGAKQREARLREHRDWAPSFEAGAFTPLRAPRKTSVASTPASGDGGFLFVDTPDVSPAPDFAGAGGSFGGAGASESWGGDSGVTSDGCGSGGSEGGGGDPGGCGSD